MEVHVLSLEDFIPETEAAAIVDRSPVTLQRWRRLRIGPPFYRRLGRIFYDRNELAEWIKAGRVETREVA